MSLFLLCYMKMCNFKDTLARRKDRSTKCICYKKCNTY